MIFYDLAQYYNFLKYNCGVGVISWINSFYKIFTVYTYY